MQINIIGVGAMGSLFGAKLNHLGNVTLIGHWPEQLARLQNQALIVEEANGRRTNYHLQVTKDPTGVPPARLVLILVKSYQTSQAAHIARKLLAPTGLALTLQNGLGNLETLTAVLGEKQVASGITSAGAAMVQAGHVRVAGLGQTHLAQKPEQAEIIQEIMALFRQAGFPTELTSNPDSLIWGKLAVNAGINPLTAILRVPNGYLAQHEATRQLMIRAAEEVAAVAQAKGISLPYPDAGEQALMVAQATATNISSMLQDINRGTNTEIEAICGAMVAHGRDHNIPTPVNLTFYRCVKKIENQQWKPGSDPDKLVRELQRLIAKSEGHLESNPSY